MVVAATTYPDASLFPSISPTYGLSPEQQTVWDMVPSAAPTPTTTVANQTTSDNSLAHAAFMDYMNSVTGGAIGNDNDPSNWTPEEAVSQTDKALARIGQANPELAQQLAEQRGRAEDDGGIGGFLGDVVGAVGSVFKTGAMGILEVLDRSSHIIPEIVHDWGKESAWKNFGDAVSGNSDIRWHDVLRDDFGLGDSWMTAVAGFIGDVATDPLTYVTFGMGGVAKSTAARLGVELSVKNVIGKEGGLLLEDMIRQGVAKNVDEAAQILVRGSEAGSQLAEKAAGSVMSKVRKAMGIVDQDAWGDVTYRVGHDVEDATMRAMLDDEMRAVTGTINDVWNAATTQGWGRITAKQAAEMGIDKAAVDAELKGLVHAGSGFTWAGGSRYTYEQGKVASALLGGVRVRLPVPILGFRLQSTKLIPLSEKMDFAVFRSFFAGMSGGTRLGRMIGKGATMDHMQAFWQGGFKGLKDFDPKVAEQLGGGFLHLGSVFYPLSEQVGKMTAAFAPHAKMYRGGGWGAKAMGDANAQARHAREQVKDTIEIVEGAAEGAPVIKPKDGDAAIIKGLGYESAFTGYMKPPEDLAKLNAEVDSFFHTRLYGQPAGVSSADFIDPLIARAEAAGDVALAQTLREQKAAGMAAEAAIAARGANATEATRIAHQRVIQGHEQLLKNGIYPDTVPDELLQADELRAPDARRLLDSRGGENVVHIPAEPRRFTGGLVPEDIITDGVEGVPVRGIAMKKGTRTVEEAAAAVPAPVTKSAEQVKAEVNAALLKSSYKPGSPAEAKALLDNVADEATKARVAQLDAEIEQIAKANRARADAAAGKVPTQEDQLAGAKLNANLDARMRERTQILNDLRKQVGASAAPSSGVMVVRPEFNAEYVVAPKNVYRSGGQAIDVFAEHQRATAAFLDDVDARMGTVLDEAALDDVTDEAMKRVIAGERQQLEAEMNAAWLKEHGFDAYETKVGDDTYTILVGDERPLARVNPHAPWQGQANMHAPRLPTEAVVRKVSRMPANAQLPGGSKKWLDRLVRNSATMPFERAEAYMRQELGKVGIVLRPHETALDIDVFKAIKYQAKRSSEDITDMMLGKVARNLENLGFFDSPWRGGVPGGMPYRYVVNDGAFDAFEKYMGNLKKAEERAAKHQREVDLPELEARVQALADGVVEQRAIAEQGKARALAEVMSARERAIGARGLDPEAVAAHDAEMGELAEVLDQADNRTQRGFEGLLREKLDNPQGVMPSGTHFDKVDDLGEGREIWREMDDIKWDPEIGTWVDAHGIPSVGQVRYFGVDNGVVKSVRTAGLQSVPAEGADIAYETLRKGAVGALTAPSAQGGGWGSMLLDQHWKDAGVETWDDVESIIREQSQTTLGAKLNESKIRRMAKQQVDAARALHEEAKHTMELQTMEQKNLVSEFNRLKSIQTLPGAPMKPAVLPIENARNMTGFQQVVINGHGSMAMPTFLAQEFVRASEGFKTLEGFHRQWRQFNSFWKSMATWMWPGFHIRNVMGAWFNNWLGGVGLKDYQTNWRIRKAAREIERQGSEGYKWASTRVITKDKDIIDVLRKRGYSNIAGVSLEDATYADLAELQVGLGLTSANGRAFAEAELPVEKTARLGGKRTRLEKSRLPGWYAKGMRGAGTMTENMFRGAAFVRGLRDYGEISEARLFTMMRHGDYADLTDFEYGVVRDVIPFYKWMRTNLPLQIHQLFESPGKLLAVKKGQEAVFDLQGRDFSEDRYKMPDWLQESFVVPFGKDDAFNAVTLDLPMSDLFMGTREFASSFLPLVRPVLESYVFERSTFSGAPIEGKKVPLAAAFQPAAGLLSAIGVAERGDDGTAYISDKTQNLLGMVPMFSRFRNWMYADPDRVKLRTGSLASAMFGVGLRPIDEQTMASSELDFYYSQVLPAMEHLKQMGYELPTTDDLESTLQTTDTILRKLGISESPLTAT